MSPFEMESFLSQLMPVYSVPFDKPTEADWQRIEDKFGCKLDEDFKEFINLMSAYQFPGEINNVSSGKTNGNDPIAVVYDFEMKYDWDPAMIPYYGIGNGDYYCLNKNESPRSKVYYRDHESSVFELCFESFELWMKDLT